MFELAFDNLSSPLILSFVLGLFAALVRSDLHFPEAIAKALSLYLLFAIGFKGGVSVSDPVSYTHLTLPTIYSV